MIEWPLIFMGGLMGSSHCIGMCGPLALALGSNEAAASANLRRQLVYSVGRIFTYSVLGAAAGFGGLWLNQQPTTLVNIQAAMAIVAGLVLIVLGLMTTGILPRRQKPSGMACLAGSWLSSFLTSPGWTNVFLAGLFTGFIPCGLVYVFSALAASSGNMLYGAATMALFGLGTVPIMVLTGCGGTLLSVAVRWRILRVAAWCVVLTGLISIARGAGFLDLAGTGDAGSCPYCP